MQVFHPNIFQPRKLERADLDFLRRLTVFLQRHGIDIHLVMPGIENMRCQLEDRIVIGCGHTFFQCDAFKNFFAR